LKGEIAVHGKSTVKVDLLARWEETVDRLEEDAPRTITARTHVAELPVDLPGAGPAQPELDDTQLQVTPGIRYIPGKDKLQFSFVPHAFGDPKHRKVRYHPVAATRFRDYFPKRSEERRVGK